MSAVAIDMMYRTQPTEMEIDETEVKILDLANKEASKLEEQVEVPVKRKRNSKTYLYSERDIRRYQQSKKEGGLRFPDLFMYHIQISTDEVQREQKMKRKIQEQAQELARKAVVNEQMIAIKLEDKNSTTKNNLTAGRNDFTQRINNNNNSNYAFNGMEQHTENPCDESVALKSDIDTHHHQAGKVASTSNSVIAPLQETQKPSKRGHRQSTSKLQIAIDGGKSAGRVLTRKVIPVLAIAAAGFAGVLIVTSSVGIGVAVAIPCAAVAYGSIKLYEYCKTKRADKRRDHHVGL